ncbi:AmmeMemoRadiSam system radical SAM enzyme [Geomesophilobacter sediminis]|uniref:AmmeMemoRadiSam system radical SAM enzyme n=1 Tax=Geomesophilobacter sediminis TaxID=2798584 RepID=A0A8J7LUA0_9BACT|nr:AmmeMemoRadiSam system radical SAM enzyme [Geomesophilobacter sediminis]MBJ6723535.1 AmmeMemoRadiSam system radical SAM enzyme [Geomesophilobacter sediminis]
MKEAMFQEKVGEGGIRCGLCRFHCQIAHGARGHCGVRENRGGELYSLVYGRAVAEHADPIEKKPLFHFLPGTRSYSIATVGCNFRCLHCQNYSISQPDQGAVEFIGTAVSPEEIVARALAAGCRSISYTYTEPTIFFEYAYDTARLARAAGLKNVFVTNGYITSEALDVIAPYLDAANIDLKGFSERFYREIIGAQLSEVLDSIVDYKRHGIWIELTTLIIPNQNDDRGELKGIADFIVNDLGPEVPWHVTQFYPTYLLTKEPRTPLATLREARRIGLDAGLRYVYEGNVPGEGGEDSTCPGCATLLVKRYGYLIEKYHVVKGRCPSCGYQLDGVWE